MDDITDQGFALRNSPAASSRGVTAIDERVALWARLRELGPGGPEEDLTAAQSQASSVI